jgi:hypothetical protein
MHGGERETAQGKRTTDGNGIGKENGKGNSKTKGMIKNTPGGDDISPAVALQLQEEMYEADSDTEGQLVRVYLERKASPAVSISSDADNTSTEKSDSEYDSEHVLDVDMSMDDGVDTLDGIDLYGAVEMARDRDYADEEDEEEEDD